MAGGITLEILDLEMARLDAIFETIRARSIEIAETNRTSIAMRQFHLSRAWHDAQSVARLAPVGTIFVPSRGDR